MAKPIRAHLRKASSVLLICLALAAARAYGATIKVGPADCSASAVNSAIASAANGDTVLLTCTGTVTWTTTVTIPSTKGVTLQVQNGTNTPKTSASFPLIVNTTSGLTAIVATIGPGNAVTRISGFRFGPNSGAPDPFFEITGAGTGTNGLGGFRVDNNYFDTISGIRMLAVWSGQSGPTGSLFGLIDNNTFHNTWRGDDPAYGPYNIQVWNYWHPAGSNFCFGCDGWTNNDFSYGSAKSVFIEDNLFEQTATAPGHMRHYISSELGARYVSRHNTFVNNFPDNNADLHDAHGLCLVNSNGAGSRGGEVYANTIQGTGYDRAVVLRGGSWLVYDNTISLGGGNGIELNEYRASSDSSQCSSTNALAPIMPPWPVPAGATWNANAPWIPAVTDASRYPLPQQIFNTYAWNNLTSGGALVSPAVPNSVVQQQYIQNNRDYFASATKPAGLSYTPYTYPHPLHNGTTGSIPPPVAPTGLTSVAR